MTPADLLARSCTDKHRHETLVIAEAAAVRIWLSQRVSLRAYACSCGGYHLATTTTPEPRRVHTVTVAERRQAEEQRRQRAKRIGKRRRK